MKIETLLLVFLAASLPASAQVTRQFSGGEPVVLRQDQAYFLVRTQPVKGNFIQGDLDVVLVFIRELNAPELRAAEELFRQDPQHWVDRADPNVAVILGNAPYEKSRDGQTTLVAVRPGSYVFGGVSIATWSGYNRGLLTASLCLGTVKVEAKPGVITDMGTVLVARDSQPTTIPELAKVVSGRKNVGGVLPYAVAIRPPSGATSVPVSLRDLPRTPADYRAVPAFPNYTGGPISRLTALAGVLDYDRNGDVVDLRAGDARGR